MWVGAVELEIPDLFVVVGHVVGRRGWGGVKGGAVAVGGVKGSVGG
jgi:hypothetical protein